MSMHEVRVYMVQCNGCGTCADDNNYYWGWMLPAKALEVALAHDWRQEGTEHYCPDCYGVQRGEEDDEEGAS